ncbi:MAG: hypothetical protein HY316_06825 [Acidobacteria bacterium]|nr:hypothetical protein [Acidobacteriota bacterium]
MEPNPEAMAAMSRLLPPMTRAISMLIPGRDSRIAWQNAKNNAEIIQLVAHVSAVLPPPGTEAPLFSLVEKCYALGTFPALWAIEGLGHWYADSFYQRNPSSNEEPRELLSSSRVEGLPEKSLTMLHAGIGMSFAKRNLAALKASSPASEIRTAAGKVVDLCRNSSRPGYAGCASESLGLASRFLHGTKMVRALDEQLAQMGEKTGEDLVGYLWHGAGRAMYFSPPNFMPAWHTPWRAVQMCRTEPPHDLGRRSAAAGFAWAITLVNMRFPVIMETLLKYHGEEFLKDDAFANGVMSSLIMRYDITPDDSVLAAYRQHRPAASDKRLADLWQELVKAPAEKALTQIYPDLKQHRKIEEVFRYQDLAALVASL